ncbi:MAG: hypothetical protein P4M10_01540, partial [Verrucomicrobiae bacterium]|nr:hypothetical protein [Verrucomicrobiae bacterium]
MDSFGHLKTPDSAASDTPNSNSRTKLLTDAARHAIDYLNGEDERSVAPLRESVAALEQLRGPLPEGATDAAAVLELLV